MRPVACACLTLSSILAGAAGAAPAAVSCDPTCLERIADAYRQAYVRHDPRLAPFAAQVRFSENNVQMKFPDASWDTVSVELGPVLTVSDPASGNVGIYTAVLQHDVPGFLAVRLRIRGGRITEVEQLLSTRRNLSAPPTPIGDARSLHHDADIARLVPASERSSRAQLIALADGYFATLENNTGEIRHTRFARAATRLENGLRFTDIEQAFRLGRYRFNARVRDRDYFLVDERRGVVMSRAFIDHKGVLDAYALTDGTPAHSPFHEPQTWALLELFKIRSGMISAVETTFIAVPYYMRSPWSRAPGDP
jgi:hypothetical protein